VPKSAFDVLTFQKIKHGDHQLMKKTLLCTSLFAVAITAAAATDSQNSPIANVDPRIGVLGDGATVIGPALPFGSIHPSPDTADGTHSGYSPKKPIRGFSQLHVSGTGWGQYGCFLVSPQIGLATKPDAHESDKADEKAEAHQYQVRLSRYDILTQVTPAKRSAIYRFTFPESNQAHILLDAAHHIPGDVVKQMKKYLNKPIPASLTISEDGRSISGTSRYPGGFGGPYTVHFYAEFDRAPTAIGTWRDDKTEEGSRKIESSGKLEHLGSYARFDTKAGDVIQMKIGVSFLSVEQAKASLTSEIPDWSYDKVRDTAAKQWSDTLNAIKVKGGTDDERTIFYTALYHAHIMPRDRTGEFARFDPKAPMWDDHYAIWDTWRTMYPLMALIRPDMVRDSVNSFIERQRVDGSVADTFVGGSNQLREQGGNGVDEIIADAHAKKIPGIDWEKAYGVMKYNADKRRNGANFDDPKLGDGPYRKLGWIPADYSEQSKIMSNSMTLEYSYNDFGAAQLAEALGKKDDAKTYYERSKKWENLWNPNSENDGFKGFMMPRNVDGTWLETDHKKYPGSWKPYFYEANTWTYSYFVPHQVAKLVELMGGKEQFIKRLEYAFEKNLLDLYNEPAFLPPQWFHYVGRPDLAAKWIHHITTAKYSLKGYPGDDDSGAMSSYYVWAKLGLFPNAGQDIYFINGPAFEHAVVNRPGQGALEVTRQGKGIYVASVKLNGKTLTQSWLRHADLNGKAKLEFVMSETPTEWATKSAPPPSLK
jgi:predicted alpha-1,2-mannosidase